MKTNLSSQIKLDQIPSRYYDPQGEIELTALTREEKVYTRIFETNVEGSTYIAVNMARYINRYVNENGKCVLALGAGNSTHSVYNELIRLYNDGVVSFENVIIYNISEFFPLLPEGPSTMKRLREVFVDHINIKPENIHTFDTTVTKDNMFEYCREYVSKIEAEGGLDITMCEIGPMGALGFNEPGSLSTSTCRMVLTSSPHRLSLSASATS